MSVRTHDPADEARDNGPGGPAEEPTRRRANHAAEDHAEAGLSRHDRRLRGRRENHPTPLAPLAEAIGKTRFVVLVAVVSVILVSVA
ncbi:MAG TPA: hypothetical protein VFH48_43045, partial [Chloroflexota bacterium]|nr:hypothetical protein [Chloroflexota bacterium]